MSGPKDYYVPPSYSLSVFNGKLNQVFEFQCNLTRLFEKIGCLAVDDQKLDIHFNCQQNLKLMQENFGSLLKALVFDYQGTFGQDTYNQIDREIEQRISALKDAISECEDVINEFLLRKEDYDSYVTYSMFYENTKISFDEFKSQVMAYLKTQVGQQAPEIAQNSEDQISSVCFRLNKVGFNADFRLCTKSEKDKVLEHVIGKEVEINKIRATTCNQILQKYGAHIASGTSAAINSASASPEIEAVKEKISTLIRQCPELPVKRKYNLDFEQLIKSQTLKDVFYYYELHDQILESENTRKFRLEVQILISSMIDQFHTSCLNEYQDLVSFCSNLLKSTRIKEIQVDDAKRRYDILKAKSDQCFHADEIRKKEHLFLKSQIILCLENMGYEVMDDLEVIDFEKEDNFLLKIHQQNNYLNLKFKEDGSVNYVFQIPEKREKLNADEENLKLNEMRITCSEFKEVLSDLSKMGLKLDLRNERPVESNSLVTLTNKQKETLVLKSESKRSAKQLRKKYLI
jgi:hypothetical protein